MKDCAVLFPTTWLGDKLGGVTTTGVLLTWTICTVEYEWRRFFRRHCGRRLRTAGGRRWENRRSDDRSDHWLHGTLGAIIQRWRINRFGGGCCWTWQYRRQRYDIHHGQRRRHTAIARPHHFCIDPEVFIGFIVERSIGHNDGGQPITFAKQKMIRTNCCDENTITIACSRINDRERLLQLQQLIHPLSILCFNSILLINVPCLVNKRPVLSIPNRLTVQVLTWEDMSKVWQQTNECKCRSGLYSSAGWWGEVFKILTKPNRDF